jgi:predicted hydrolase (HD superfamily)
VDHRLGSAHEYTKQSLRNTHWPSRLHGRCARNGEDEEKWAITGLIHDFDYDVSQRSGPSEEVIL